MIDSACPVALRYSVLFQPDRRSVAHADFRRRCIDRSDHRAPPQGEVAREGPKRVGSCDDSVFQAVRDQLGAYCSAVGMRTLFRRLPLRMDGTPFPAPGLGWAAKKAGIPVRRNREYTRS